MMIDDGRSPANLVTDHHPTMTLQGFRHLRQLANLQCRWNSTAVPRRVLPSLSLEGKTAIGNHPLQLN
jgi:hypothetical protein